jgi:hypothetical protein
MASLVGGLGGLLGGSAALTQIFLYNLVQQLISASLAPYLTQATVDVQSSNPVVPLPPPDLAEMVLKTILTPGAGAEEAAKSGENAERFANRVLNTGEPPGIEMVLNWARRGFVPWGDAGPGVPSVPEAVRTSRIRSDWLDTILASQWLPITAADAVNAWVRGQIPEAQALQLLSYSGYQPDMAQILYNTTGRPPAPGELSTFVRRGKIPLHGTGSGALTFEQGIIEGDLKDKWEPIFEKLVVAYPGVFEVLQMQKEGGLPASAAAELYAIAGILPEYSKYLVAAGSGATVAAAKNLTETLVLKLYADQIISVAQTTSMLEALGYSSTQAEYLIDLQDLDATVKALSSAVSKVRALFLANKIPASEAQTALAEFGVAADVAQNLIGVWTAEQAMEVKTLTAAEITDAVYYGVIAQADGMSYLENLGYQPFDAWVLISNKLKAPQPNPPAPTAAGPNTAI